MIIDNAYSWHDRGIATIPIGWKSKRPTLAWKQYQTRLPTKQELRRWFDRKYVNIAVITGHRGLVIIDHDNMGIWQLWQGWSKHLPNTYRVKTARGTHVYYLMKNPPERTLKLPGIDVKAAGGYCLCPPSIHPSGASYTALSEQEIATVDCIEDVLPSMLLREAAKPVKIPVSCGKSDPFNVPEPVQGDAIGWIKANVDILSFFPNAVRSSSCGRWYADFCPFHDDGKRSFWIDVSRQKCGCAACLNGSLDCIDFVCLLENVNRSVAIKKLVK